MKHFALPFVALLCGSSFNVNAQISFGGSPLGLRAEKLALSPAPVVHMPAIDVGTLKAEDAARLTTGKKGPYRFGWSFPTDLTTANSGVWNTLANGDRLWRLSIECAEALSINFVFTHYIVPAGGEVFVYNSNGILGSFTAESAAGRTEMGVAPLSGDRITIEYHEPAAVTGTGALTIGQVTHGYRDPESEMKSFGDSGSCNNNVVCPEGDPWRSQIRSVARIINGGDWCTGQLLNNCAEDGTPYFLTANHCYQSNVGSWVFQFNWESPTCTPTAQGPTTHTVSGATMKVHNSGSDVCLLQLNSVPPESYNVFYTGWDKSGTTPTSATCIHHPSGDIKKISFDNDALGQSTEDLGNGPAQCWHIFNWDDGTTEGGSSGSGLWNENGLLVGQLYGGQAYCGNNVNDYFGRFDVSYPLLEPWLGTCGNTLNGFPSNVPLALDMKLQSIDGVLPSYCGEQPVHVSITIKNTGSTAVTSATIGYAITDGPSGSIPWSGNLAPNATASVALTTFTPSNGSHTVTASVTSPNSGTDLDPTNDTRTLDLLVTSPAQTLTFQLHFDDYPEETTWELRNSGNVVVASGGPYDAQPDGSTLPIPLCVTNDCYTLVVDDASGDGICCGYGEGDFQVVDQWGAAYVTNNGTFTTSVSEPFCVTNTGIPEDVLGSLLIVPNPNAGSFDVRLNTNSVADLRLVDALGRAVWSSHAFVNGSLHVELPDVENGLYLLDVTIAGARTTVRMIVRH